MKKKKRKKANYSPQKGDSPKQIALQAYKFRMRILEICDIFGAREYMESLPIQEYFYLFQIRFRPIKVIGMEEINFPRGTVGMLRKHLKEKFLEINTFSFPGYEGEVCYSDYFTYILTLRHWYRTLDKDTKLNKERLAQELHPLLALGDLPDNPEQMLVFYLRLLGSSISETPEKFCYYFEKDDEIIGEYPQLMVRVRLTLKVAATDKKHVKFSGGENREVFSVFGWDRKGLFLASLKSEDLDSKTVIKGLTFPVYMQNHATERLKERLDVFTVPELILHIGESVLKKQVVPDGPNRGLLGYYFYGYLLGYLVLEIIDGIIVIRTFLFLTNDSTPEGKKLNKILGVAKLDKKYTGLDQLSTFIHGDLKEDEQLYKALKDAGCSILLNMNSIILDHTQKKETMLSSEEIKNYLELG